jgi:hypothetical protein
VQHTCSLSSTVSHSIVTPSLTDPLQFSVPTVLCLVPLSVFYNFSSSIQWEALPYHPIQVQVLLTIVLSGGPLFCLVVTSCSPFVHDHTEISSFVRFLDSGTPHKFYLALLLLSIRKCCKYLYKQYRTLEVCLLHCLLQQQHFYISIVSLH